MGIPIEIVSEISQKSTTSTQLCLYYIDFHGHFYLYLMNQRIVRRKKDVSQLEMKEENP